MVLNSKMSYDKLSEKVGEKLGVEATHLRFYTVNASSNNPRAAVKRGQNQTLQSILVPAGYGQLNMNQRNDALFFEVLDMSLAELDTKKSIKLTLLSEGITKEVSDENNCGSGTALILLFQDQFDVLVPKNGQVDDLIDCLLKKAKLPSEKEAGRIRVYEISNHKFFRELERNYPVISINDYTTVIAERIPTEDADIEDQSQFIPVFQFHSEPSRAHGIPFRFLLKEGETFAETKKRLEKRTGLKGKSFEKIKFAVVRRAQFSRPQYLTDGEPFSQTPLTLEWLANMDGCRRHPLGRGGGRGRLPWLRPPRPDEVGAERRRGSVSQGLDIFHGGGGVHCFCCGRQAAASGMCIVMTWRPGKRVGRFSPELVAFGDHQGISFVLVAVIRGFFFPRFYHHCLREGMLMFSVC
jgi:hypothetical protein